MNNRVNLIATHLIMNGKISFSQESCAKAIPPTKTGPSCSIAGNNNPFKAIYSASRQQLIGHLPPFIKQMVQFTQ